MKINQKLKEKIIKNAFQMFRDWTENAKEDYPQYDFVIIDEQKLVIDLEETIKSAIKSLKKDEREHKEEGYKIGFVCGFIQSNLNQKWVHEYIAKQTNDYKNFMMLKTIQEYFEFKEIEFIRLNKLYKIMVEKDSNLENIHGKPEKLDIQKELDIKSEDFDVIDLKNQKNDIEILLQNMIIKQIKTIFDEENDNYMFDTDNYFSRTEIKELINAF